MTSARIAFRVEFGMTTNDLGMERPVSEVEAHQAMEGIDPSALGLRTFSVPRVTAVFTVDADVLGDVERMLDADDRVVAYSYEEA